ncbi:MAG: response regulator transcription factor [Muribaculaceae bacterium]|nr:response regulator transcription factor [Muribaculaceae bacterium]
MSYRILVIDDEEPLCDILKYNLEKEGFVVDCSYSAVEALERDLTQYDLFIVDIMMERLSGYDFVRRLRSTIGVEKLPVIFCSALGDEDDKVTGLNLGGDDYITKPFVISEVLARVRAVLRRSQAVLRPRVSAAKEQDKKQDMLPDVEFRGIRIDQNEKVCYIEGVEVPLTRTEFDLLLFFLNNRNRIYSREEIIRRVWPDDVLVSQRAIDTNLTRLRKKLGTYGNNIITRQGFGYGFKEGD